MIMKSSAKLAAALSITALTLAATLRAQDVAPSPPAAPLAVPVVPAADTAEFTDAAEEQIEQERARLDAELQRAEDSIAALRDSDAEEIQQHLAATRARMDHQLAEARKAIVLAQNQVELPVHEVYPVPPAVPRKRLNALVGRSPSKALLIRFDPNSAAGQSNLEEDLAVMARVLEKSVLQNLGDDNSPKASGIQVLFSPEGGSTRNVYLEGYGALFTLSVRFPLLAPEKKAEEEKPKEAADSSWEEARRDLYGQADPWNVGDMFRFERHGGDAPEYDAGKVDRLRKALLDAFKSATNIRGLKPDDWVSVVVFGSATPNKTRVDVVKTGAKAEGKVLKTVRDERTKSEIAVVEEVSTRSRSGSVLALRVKKSEVDEFAKGRLDADQFARKVSMATYAADTGGWSSDFRFF